jgi:cbb3-type cytochrome oxidase subunit 3
MPLPQRGEGEPVMLWIAIEALLALFILLFVVWWTMFAGRRKGERRQPKP